MTAKPMRLIGVIWGSSKNPELCEPLYVDNSVESGHYFRTPSKFVIAPDLVDTIEERITRSGFKLEWAEPIGNSDELKEKILSRINLRESQSSSSTSFAICEELRWVLSLLKDDK